MIDEMPYSVNNSSNKKPREITRFFIESGIELLI